MTTTQTPAQVGVAEHLHRPRTKGWGSLGVSSVSLAFAGIIVCFIVLLFTPPPKNLLFTVLIGFMWALGWLVLTRKDQHGDTLPVRRAIRRTHRKAQRSGKTHYRSGPGTRVGTWAPPGVLTDTHLTLQHDESDDSYGMLFNPATGDHAVTFKLNPDGATLAGNFDAAVERWDETIRGLCREHDLPQVQIIVETAADPGFALQDWLLSKVVDDAPDRGRDVVEDLAADSPRGASSVETWLTLTFAGGCPRPPRWWDKAWNWTCRRPPLETVQTVSEAEMAASLAARLPVIAKSLAGTGAGEAVLATPDDITTAVRIAFDPQCADTVAKARVEGRPWIMRWGSAGPVTADDCEKYYRSGGAWHRTWDMTKILGAIRDESLNVLLESHKQLLRKRVVITYTLHDPGTGARLAQRDKSTADYTVRTSKIANDDQLRHQKSTAVTSQHRADHGATIVDVSLAVTCSILDPTRPREEGDVEKRPDLRTMNAIIGGLSPQAQLQLRPADGCQALAFTRTLPCVGLRPQLLSDVPAWMGASL